ncbi:MAG TPA: anti-sigma factor antagonist [bacterium]|nr:anti-sigma factor antagonist [bacterium]HPI75466.1 anti-sigma factor antagonist [bacterium]HPN93376.1 anti-sigma factor antagonist [bacterium]
MDLKLEVKREKEYTYVTVNGEIDLYNAHKLKEKIGQTMDGMDSPNMVLDLKDVDYIDSTGLGILIGIKRRVSENKGELALVLRSDRIHKLFEITGLINIFAIARSSEEAIARLSK